MNEPRLPNSCTHQFARDVRCLRCGIYQHSSPALKTNIYNTPSHFKYQQHLASLRKTSCKVITPKEISEDTHLLLTSICHKFIFTNETLALGLSLYQYLQNMNPNQKFWASVCLIVAGKAVELDKNRYAQKSYSQQQYEQAERTVFQSMNFDIQMTTFVTFIDFYLSSGVLFQQDSLNPSLIEFFEDHITQKVKENLKNGVFTKHKPQILALSIIKETRVKYNLAPWNEHLLKMTGYSQEDITLGDSAQTLREITNSSCAYKLSDIKGLTVRKKYENVMKTEKPLLQKYSSISKGMKENSYSTSKMILGNRSKPNITYSILENYTSINSDLLNKRR